MDDPVLQVLIKAASALGRIRVREHVEALDRALDSRMSKLRREVAAGSRGDRGP